VNIWRFSHVQGADGNISLTAMGFIPAKSLATITDKLN